MPAPALVSLHFRNVPRRSLFASGCFARSHNLSPGVAWHLSTFIMHFITALSALKFHSWKLGIPKFSLCAFLRSWRNYQSCKKFPDRHPQERKTTPADHALAKQNKLVQSEATSFLKFRVQTNSSRLLARDLAGLITKDKAEVPPASCSHKNPAR